jgi:hypothetical protein
MKKKIIAIDINEVIRSHWSSVEQHYLKYMELMKDEPQIVHPFNSYEYLNHFKFKEKIVDVKYLKEVLAKIPTELYHEKNSDGTYKSDVHLFDSVKETLTPQNQLENFLYNEYLWEVFGNCGKVYSNVAQDVNDLYKKYMDDYQFKIVSLEEYRSIPPTLFFLSKVAIQIPDYSFYGDPARLWKECDICITTNPKLLDSKPSGKISIKINREFNSNTNAVHAYDNISDLLTVDLSKITRQSFWQKLNAKNKGKVVFPFKI